MNLKRKNVGKPRANSGFTLIELIIVIVILGVLSVVALPSFIDLSDDANDAVLQSMNGSYQSVVDQVQLKWEVKGQPQGGNNRNGPQVEISPGLLVTVDRDSGFPVGSNGIDAPNNMSIADCEEVFNDLIETDFTVARRNQVNNGNFRDFDIIVTRTNQNPDICNYYFSESVDSRPGNAVPSEGRGLQYFPGTGDVTTFSF